MSRNESDVVISRTPINLVLFQFRDPENGSWVLKTYIQYTTTHTDPENESKYFKHYLSYQTKQNVRY